MVGRVAQGAGHAIAMDGFAADLADGLSHIHSPRRCLHVSFPEGSLKLHSSLSVRRQKQPVRCGSHLFLLMVLPPVLVAVDKFLLPIGLKRQVRSRQCKIFLFFLNEFWQAVVNGNV